jgi:hypothetical protein
MAEKTEVTHDRVKKQIHEALQQARTLRDEIRVEVHLASLDAQDRWKKLEPALGDAERFGAEVTEAARKAAADVAKSFQEFRASLKRHTRET